MLKKLDLSFFEEGTESVQQEIESKEPDYDDMSDEDFQKAIDNVRFAKFDEEDETAQDEEYIPSEDNNEGTESEVSESKESEPTAETPAEKAVPQQPSAYGNKYDQLIGAIENDPEFRQSLADAIVARRNKFNAPAEQPKAEVEKEDKEPEQGDDELFEDFERRRSAWESRQQEKKTREAVEKVLMEERNARMQEAYIQRTREVGEMLRQDVEAPAVSGFLAQNPAPARLMQLMNEDPDVFMYMYDGFRQIIGKGNYFASEFAKRRGVAVSPVQSPQTQSYQQTQPAAQTSGAQRTVAKKPPYTEGAGISGGRGGTGTPDFQNMSDKEFSQFMQRVKMQGM